jgi:hypothetical protein
LGRGLSAVKPSHRLTKRSAIDYTAPNAFAEVDAGRRFYHLGAAIVAVAANGDVGERPVLTDHAHEACQKGSTLQLHWLDRGS